ncbi:MAG: glycoside hydrolase family 3 N-terminal domain-containing protein [Eubacteriales bacterium]|nr:glycoside hydrolase family 3 N-terminal domain-containing protein [Eubacteriales bacterium]
MPETTVPDPVGALMEALSVEEKVGQLFLARCDAQRAVEDIAACHLGGFVLFKADFENETPDTLRSKLRSYQDTASIPLLLAVDEEGGTVTRISRFPAFRDQVFPSPREAYDYGGFGWALVMEDEKIRMLADLGLNVNLGPVCDMADDPAGFMYERSLGQDAETTGEFVAMTVDLMSQNRIGSVLKHFPGYGNNADTHVGMARDSRSLSELEGRDLRPFAAGIEAGADAVLVTHTIVEALDGELPASLSPAVHRYLRETMGFAGVILTDDLVMEAITDRYGAGEAAVLAVQAGNDLLCSTDYLTQYQAVLEAVEDGRIDMEVLDAAVRNVLEWKMELGLI